MFITIPHIIDVRFGVTASCL